MTELFSESDQEKTARERRLYRFLCIGLLVIVIVFDLVFSLLLSRTNQILFESLLTIGTFFGLSAFFFLLMVFALPAAKRIALWLQLGKRPQETIQGDHFSFTGDRIKKSGLYFDAVSFVDQGKERILFFDSYAKKPANPASIDEIIVVDSYIVAYREKA